MARLCLNCDGCVHSANALARRHPRWLLCDKCNAQPAIVRCLDENVSLCQSCEWNHSNGVTGMGHQSQAISCYTGCPSLSEISRIWSAVLDGGSASGGFGASGWESLAGSGVPKNDTNCISNCLERGDSEGSSFGVVSAGKLNEVLAESNCTPKFEPWMTPSTIIPSNPNCIPPQCKDQAPFLPQESSQLPKVVKFQAPIFHIYPNCLFVLRYTDIYIMHTGIKFPKMDQEREIDKTITSDTNNDDNQMNKFMIS